MKNPTKQRKNQIVLVGVLKNQRDLQLLLTERWYRIPIAQAPKRPFQYLAFYQPTIFKRQGKCIRYWARVVRCRTDQRCRLLPTEAHHPRAHHNYFRLCVADVKELHPPIKNLARRRISFGFTTLHRLRTANDILQLYNVPPTEQIIGNALRRAGIQAAAQYGVRNGKKRYRLDFAVFCQNGAIAIECDNQKAHAGRQQRQKDRRKNMFLKRQGWVVIRLAEHDIVANPNGCIRRIQTAIRKLRRLRQIAPE